MCYICSDGLWCCSYSMSQSTETESTATTSGESRYANFYTGPNLIDPQSQVWAKFLWLYQEGSLIAEKPVCSSESGESSAAQRCSLLIVVCSHSNLQLALSANRPDRTLTFLPGDYLTYIPMPCLNASLSLQHVCNLVVLSLKLEAKLVFHTCWPNIKTFPNNHFPFFQPCQAGFILDLTTMGSLVFICPKDPQIPYFTLAQDRQPKQACVSVSNSASSWTHYSPQTAVHPSSLLHPPTPSSPVFSLQLVFHMFDSSLHHTATHCTRQVEKLKWTQISRIWVSAAIPFCSVLPLTTLCKTLQHAWLFHSHFEMLQYCGHAIFVTAL